MHGWTFAPVPIPMPAVLPGRLDDDALVVAADPAVPVHSFLSHHDVMILLRRSLR